jgi:streptogramin lyase
MCVSGRQVCPIGVWSSCHNEVLPEVESCNDLDDDCDGIVDEGVRSPCGGCDPSCYGGVWGPPAAPFEAGGGLGVSARGELTLAFSAIESRTVWVPNTGEGTVSKIDADEAREVARYRVGGATPERVAIDYLGDAWVLSPALEGRSQLTRVAGERARCVPGGAGLQTSAGPEQVLALGEDSCVTLRDGVGNEGEVARTLSVDGTRSVDQALGGRLWVGMQKGHRVVQISADEGAVLREVATAEFSPFDSVFDPWGTLWLIDRAGLLARIDTAAEPLSAQILEAPLACYQFDSLASDGHGVLTLTGAACENVVSYDPQLERWQVLKTEGVLDTRGVAVLADERWVVHTAARLSRVSRDPFAIAKTFALAGLGAEPIESTAIGADSRGRLWVVSSMGGQGGSGLVTQFEPERGEVLAQIPLGRLPRPRGDIVGDRRLGSFAPQGSAQHRFDGCLGGGTTWTALHVTWLGGEGASAEIELRRAQSAQALGDSAWQRVGVLPQDLPPFALALDRGGVVEVRLTLRGEQRLGSPRIASVGIEWRCAGPD